MIILNTIPHIAYSHIRNLSHTLSLSILLTLLLVRSTKLYSVYFAFHSAIPAATATIPAAGIIHFRFSVIENEAELRPDVDGAESGVSMKGLKALPPLLVADLPSGEKR